MANANKAKGTRFESAIRDYATSLRLRAFRPAQAGAGDLGDVHVDGVLCIQAKDVARWSVSQWIDDAKDQAIRAGLPFSAVVMKKRRASIGDAYAVMTLDDLLTMVHRLSLAERLMSSSPHVFSHYKEALREKDLRP